MLQVKIGRNIVNFGLVVVDMQNGFVSNNGSYDKLGMNIENYQKVIPKIKELINFCRRENIPIFYTEAVREPSGIDLLIHVHNILPRTREERLINQNIPICVRGTWDAQTIDEVLDLFTHTLLYGNRFHQYALYNYGVSIQYHKKNNALDIVKV